MLNKIKSCPFCGKKAFVYMVGDGFSIGCNDDCIDFFGEFIDEDAAIEAWNRRIK